MLFDIQSQEMIEKRLNAATRGVWNVMRIAGGYVIYVRDNTNNRVVRGAGGVRLLDDADFIAHAPDDVRYLLSCLREAEAKIREQNLALSLGHGRQESPRGFYGDGNPNVYGQEGAEVDP